LYQKAAEKGYRHSIYPLAKCYEKGEGTERNLEMAIYWYQKEAVKGNVYAQINLVELYYNNEETEGNFEKSFY